MAQPPSTCPQPAARRGHEDALSPLQAPLVLLVAMAALLHYVDRQATSAISPTLTGHFHLTDWEWGWVNSAFSLVYIVTSCFGGAWIDRVGVRKGLLISIAVWSVAAAGHALATGFWSLCFWRM